MAEAPLSAEEIAHRGFPSSFRGFDPAEVRAYLVRVANELKAAATREVELRQKLADAERRAANPVIDQAMLTRALGDETARVLASAQQAAHELKSRAEESVAGILREAHVQAQQIRAAAEVVLADRTEEADAAAAEIRAAAQAEAVGVLEQARREVEATRDEVAGQSRQLVQEAQAARARVLGDLARRRRIAHTQVEQLRAGRERLLDAYRVVRRTLDEVADELERVEPEARAAASAAARRAEEALRDSADVAVPGEGNMDGEPGGDDARPVDVGSVESTVEAPVPALPPTAPDPTIEPVPPSEPAPVDGRPAPMVRLPSSAPADPVVAREEHTEERKLSSLRILRRPRAESVPDAAVPEAPSPAAPVRIIGATAEQPVPSPPSPRPTIPSITPGVAWSVPPPATSPPPPATVDRSASEPAPERPADTPTRQREPEGALATPPDIAVPPSSKVDDLFARLRAATPHEAATPASPATPQPESEAEPASDGATPAPVADAEARAADHEVALQRRDEAIEAIEVALARKLKRALQDEHNDVLDRLRSCREVPTTTEAFLPPPADQVVRYGAAAEDLLCEAAQCGAGLVPSGGTQAGAVDVGDVVAELIDSLVGPLRRTMERGVEGDPEDTAALVDCVGAAYRDCRSQRLEGLAGDATIAAFSRGTVRAASGTAVRWIVDDGDRACPDCDDNALAGPTPSGQLFPTGQPHPPAHAGCRCLLVPDAP